MKTKVKNKTFDCIEMKRRGAEKIHKQLATLTFEQQLAFWQERTELLRKRQQVKQCELRKGELSRNM